MDKIEFRNKANPDKSADNLLRNIGGLQSGVEVDNRNTTSEDISLRYKRKFVGKYKTKGKITESIQSIRTRQGNIVLHLPGPKGEATIAIFLIKEHFVSSY